MKYLHIKHIPSDAEKETLRIEAKAIIWIKLLLVLFVLISWAAERFL